MTLKEVSDMVAEIGLDYAYYEFPDDTERQLPFVCFLFTGSDDIYADDINYVDKRTLAIELYTKNKDFETEQTVRDVLLSHNLSFTVGYDYLHDEQCYITVFTTQVIITPAVQITEAN